LREAPTRGKGIAMKVLITGGTGFVGSHLTTVLLREGHEVTLLTRSPRGSQSGSSGVSLLQGDPTRQGPWQEAVRSHDAVINLAGASIFSRWTDEQKKAIRESRILTTRNLVAALPSASEKATTLLSTSAVGYYGFHGDEELDETSPPGNDFLARIAVDWEEEALKAAAKGVRVAITRFGIVLGERGGALGQMIPFFRKYLGGPLGSGRQWFSWIHIRDLGEACLFLLRRRELSGPFNLCSPDPVRNKDLARALGKALHRPSFLPAPGFMIRLVLGEFGTVILKGQKVLPRRLLDEGFVFQCPDIERAVEEIVCLAP
jgi:uncharacterized protein